LIGPATVEVLMQQLQRRRHPEESLRASLGILRLAKDFSPAALERAAERAVTLATFSYRALRALIGVPDSTPEQPSLALAHANVRGGEYFR
jgi:hypothetical protein